MERRIIAFLILFPVFLPSGFVVCKSNCEITRVPNRSALHSCCPRSNHQFRDNDVSRTGSNDKSEEPSSDPDCCRLSHSSPYALPLQQVSHIDVLQFPVFTQFVYFTPGGGTSPRTALLEARGGPPQRVVASEITPLRI